MTVLASAIIDGHEARGNAELVQGDDGAVTLELTEFWVAPGAPDVRLFISPDPAGTVDSNAIDLGSVPSQQATLSRRIPSDLDLAALGSIIVYCKVYSVLFGYGTLTSQE